MKQKNEITVKIKCELNELYKIVEEKGFKIVDEFSIDDTFFVPEDLNLDEMDTREIISKAVLVRCFNCKMTGKISKEITFKKKEFDESGKIMSQEAVNCKILEIEEAKKLLEAIGYKEIMNIKEDDTVYEKDGFQLATKDINNGDNLIEIEENDNLNSIEKLIRKLDEIEIPICKDDYFIKKAEIELNKILKR